MNLETRDTRWSPIKALGKVQNQIADMGVPDLKVDLEEREHLDFSDLMNSSNRELEEFLIVYGGYKAYLETRISDVKAKKSALSAAFDEGYATALSRIVDEREVEGKKKLTREEIRGVALDNYPQLKELRQEIIEQESLEIQVDGLLNTYTTAYNTVSRVVTLRMDKQ